MKEVSDIRVRGLAPHIVETLKLMAVAKKKRGLETYIREILEDHAMRSSNDFLDEIDAMRRLVLQDRKGAPLTVKAQDLIRADRDA